MLKTIQDFHQEINKQNQTTEDFTSILATFFQQLYELDAKNAPIFELEETALSQILTESFQSRFQLRQKFQRLINKAQEQELLKAATDANRALRYLEDYVLEILLHKQTNKTQNYNTLVDKGPFFQIAEGEKFNSPTDIQSGDILLTRGNAFTSAAIARIGISDSQFSHLSFVYSNPMEKGKLYTVEAHIEVGSVVAPLQENLDYKNARTVVFRYEDPLIAHQAAELMYHKVKNHSATGQNIDYDFSMQYEDNSKLFCSEVIYDGFFQISNGQLDIPRFKTQFNPGLIPFLNRMGIPATPQNIATLKTFSPADIEFDNRFKLIAEWKNPNKLRDSRIKDAVLTKMFAWMENENYRIVPPVSVEVLSRIIWTIRRIPLLQKLVVKRLPLNMNLEQLQLFLTLDKIGEVFQNYIEDYQKGQAQPLSMKEMLELLEKFKQIGTQETVFQKWFRPN